MKIGGVIFGGIFFLAGFAVFYFVVLSTLLDAYHMQSWHSIKANLNSAEVSSYQSRNDNGSYTTMYAVDIEYEYQFQGKSYTGARVDLHGDSSSNSSEQYQRLSKIKQQAKQNRLNVWVNPNNASESIYNRAINFKLSLIMTLFSSVFMLVGGGIVYSSRKKQQNLPAGTIPNPGKPWTTRTEWASPTIFSDAESKLSLIKYMVIIATLFFGMFSIALFGEHPVATVFSIILLLPPVFLFRWYVKKKTEWNHYQKVPLKLSTYPGVIGGNIAGSVLIPTPFTSGDTYTFTLNCTHHWTSRSGKETKSHSNIIWSKAIKPTLKPKVNGTYLMFEFDIPADKIPSSEPDNNYHRWTIAINSELKGINFNRDYEVPVFVTQDSQTIKDELKAQPLTAKQKADIHARLSVNKDHVSQGNTESTQSITSGRNQSLSFSTPSSTTGWFIAGFGGIFFATGMGIVIGAGSNFGFFFSAMSTIFIALGVYVLGRNCQVRVTPDRLEIDVFFFSKLVNKHVFSQNDIKEIKPVKSSSTSHNGKQTHEKYSLSLLTQSGNRIDLGGEFKSMKNAVHMQLEIEAVLSGNN